MSQQQVRPETTAYKGEFGMIAPSAALSIRRIGSAVQIAMTAGSEYLAIEMFDRLVEAARRGSVRLDIGSLPGR